MSIAGLFVCRDAFVLPNHSAFAECVHFLIWRIDPDKCSQMFKFVSLHRAIFVHLVLASLGSLTAFVIAIYPHRMLHAASDSYRGQSPPRDIDQGKEFRKIVQEFLNDLCKVFILNLLLH